MFHVWPLNLIFFLFDIKLSCVCLNILCYYVFGYDLKSKKVIINSKLLFKTKMHFQHELKFLHLNTDFLKNIILLIVYIVFDSYIKI